MRGLLLAALLGGLAPRSRASDAEGFPPLTLRECIDHALMENLNLRVQRYEPAIADEQVRAEEAAFDPQFDLSGTLSEGKSAAAASELEGSAQPTTEEWGGAMAVSKRFAAGTQARIFSTLHELETDSSFSTLNPVNDAGVNLSIVQPLLRNRGALVNRADIARARIAVVGAREQLRADALELVQDIESTYWELALALEQLAVSEQAVALSEQLQAEAQARFDRGMNTKADVLWAEADVVSKREGVLVSRQQIDNARDRLLALMNDLREDTEAGFGTEPIPEELPARPDVEQSYRIALEKQPEYRLLLQRRRSLALDRDVARAQRLPTLDLSGRIGASGRDRTLGDAYRGMLDRDGHQWAVDVSLSTPWGLRREDAALTQSAYRLMQSDLQVAQAEVRLVYDVRVSCRSVWTGIERIRVTRLARDMQEFRMNQAKAQYQAGLATLRDVMDAQDDVNAARLRALEATRGTILAMVQLSRLEGSLLEAHGIAWHTIDPLP